MFFFVKREVNPIFLPISVEFNCDNKLLNVSLLSITKANTFNSSSVDSIIV